MPNRTSRAILALFIKQDRFLSFDHTLVSYADYKGVLEQTLAARPQDARGVLLADRGFPHAKLVHFCRLHGWHYRLRAKVRTLVRLPDGREVPLAKLCPPQGHAYFYHGVYLLGEGLGPVNLALANPEDTDESWYLVSDEPTDVSPLDEYGLRFDMKRTSWTISPTVSRWRPAAWMTRRRWSACS